SAYTDALAAMCDDLNTPVALAAGLRGANAILGVSRQPDGLSMESAESALAFLNRIDALLGIVGLATEADDAGADDPLAEQVETLLAEREAARAARDFARADALRDEIAALGVEVMDTPSGPTWRRTP
ncbi:MAG: DALR domain-containing protein, partial [Bacteroidota bacterium]